MTNSQEISAEEINSALEYSINQTVFEEILGTAVKKDASDVYLSYEGDKGIIRTRANGIITKGSFKKKQIESIVNHLISKGLVHEITDSLEYQNRNINLRVTGIPTPNGYAINIRILDPNKLKNLMSLGMTEDQIKKYEGMIDSTSGLVLFTGRTGSGKTTTICSTLKRILKKDNKIILTIEDPIEYALDGAFQVNVDSDNTAHNIYRNALRMNPDIVYLGEIRDFEFAELAVRASQSGSFVISTTHARDSCAVPDKILNMGIEPRLLSTNLTGIVQQTLLRKLCEDCSKEIDYKTCLMEVRSLNLDIGVLNYLKKYSPDNKFFISNPNGCSNCNNGYKGMTGVFEIIQMNDDLLRLIADGGREPELRKLAQDQKQIEPYFMFEAFKKSAQGIIDIREIKRVFGNSAFNQLIKKIY